MLELERHSSGLWYDLQKLNIFHLFILFTDSKKANTTLTNSIHFMEPDLFKCNQMPFFCEDRQLPKLIWDDQFDASGKVLGREFQEASGFITDPIWQKEVNSIENPSESDLYYQLIPGCCRCERHIIPYYFQDDSYVTEGLS